MRVFQQSGARLPGLALMAMLALSQWGCASVTHGHKQLVRVQAQCGDRLLPAQCTAGNDRGHWAFAAPASLVVNRDVSALTVQCASPFFGAQSVVVSPGVSTAAVGNLLVGGLVGAGVDMVTGSGLAYPALVVVNYPACR